MKYYLETGALRKLNKHLHTLSDDCFTSSWSLFELMSELTKSEKEYRIRKSVIQNVINSNLHIEWSSPEVLKVNGFPSIGYQDFRFDALKNLIYQFLDYSDFQSFLIDTNNHKYNYKYFNDLDKYYTAKFISGGAAGNSNMKRLIEDGAKKYGPNHATDTKLFLENLYQNEIELNEGMTLYVIVQDIIDGMELELNLGLTDKDRARIFASYNNSFDIYLKYFSRYSGKKMAEFKLPAKNDCIDLYHLLYIGDGKNKILVSDDNLLLDIKDHCINSDTFLNQYSKE